MTSLSMAMIVKNESQFLTRAIQSVQRIASEVIVVDTGSTDNTVALAEALGAKVICVAWHDDFAWARNIALDHTTGDWILMMDADEEFVEADAGRLKEAITHPTSDAYNIRIVSVAEQADQISEARVTRLFRRDPRIRWEGRIHEQVVPSLNRHGLTLSSLDIRLLHYGYLPSVMIERDKITRNRQLLEQMAKEQPEQAYVSWQLAQTLIQAGEHAEAIRLTKKALKQIAPHSDLIPLFILTLAKAYWSHTEPLMAQRTLRDGLRQYPSYTDFEYTLGLIFVSTTQWDQAIIHFNRALNLGTPEGFLQTETGVGGFKALWHLSQCHIQQANYPQSEALLLMILKTQPAFRPAWLALLSLLQNNPLDAVYDHIKLVLTPHQIIDALAIWPDLSGLETALLGLAQKEVTVFADSVES